MDGTFGAVPLRQFAPGCAGPENPKDTFKALAITQRRTTAAFVRFTPGKLGFNQLPLFICDGSLSHRAPP
jgi:hypothetical protein